MFARAGIVVLVLASPARATPRSRWPLRTLTGQLRPPIPLRYRNDPNGDQTPSGPFSDGGANFSGSGVVINNGGHGVGCADRRATRSTASMRRSWGVEVDDFFDQVDPARLAAVRYERDRIDKWIRDHLVVNPNVVGCQRCRRAIIAGDRWTETSNGDSRALPSGLLRCVAH